MSKRIGSFEFIFEYDSLTCAGSHPHDGIKAYEFLNVSSEVIQETLLVCLSLWLKKDNFLSMSHFIIFKKMDRFKNETKGGWEDYSLTWK